MQQTTEKEQQPEAVGLIISYFGNSVAVEAQDGQVFQCHLKRNQPLPVVGDRVRFVPDPTHRGTVISIEPRSSVLTRGDKRGKTRPIAANVDAILIVMAPPPIFSEHLVDRYLIAAELLQIEPILVLNKIDLLDAAGLNAAQERLAPYAQVPYQVVFSTTLGQSGLQGLSDVLKKRTAVLVGPSGVGKSSIIAGLGSEESIRIGEVSAKGSGKHTTTATRLYHLPDGGQLIDSPGVREFNLWPVSEQELLGGFKEISAYARGCRFRDCRHMAEPGCAVQAAVESAKISPLRYASFKELMNEFASPQKK